MASTDARDLREALRTIREMWPDAATADFQSSDQDSYGFVLNDVNDADGVMVSDVDMKLYEQIKDAVDQHIMNISWSNEEMDSDRGGAARVVVPPAEDFTEEEAAENTYMSDLLLLIDAFNYERCSECHNDLNKHSIGPDPLGKPHLFCLADAS